jgi:hypothetical protein
MRGIDVGPVEGANTVKTEAGAGPDTPEASAPDVSATEPAEAAAVTDPDTAAMPDPDIADMAEPTDTAAMSAYTTVLGHPASGQNAAQSNFQ